MDPCSLLGDIASNNYMRMERNKALPVGDQVMYIMSKQDAISY